MRLFWLDVRYGLRMLWKSPTLTVVSVLTMGLGVGANSSIFSVVDGVLIRSLPYEEPAHLIRIWGSSKQTGDVRLNISEMDFLDFRDQNQVFEDIAAFTWTGGGVTLSGPDGPERLRLVFVSSTFFSMLGVDAALGRGFLPNEEQPGQDRVAVLSHGLWARRFATQPDIVGQTLTLNGIGHTVVGIMPRSFRHPEEVAGQEPDLWIPLAVDRSIPNRGGRYLRAIGRVKKGLHLTRVAEEMRALAQGLEDRYPGTNTGRGVRLEPLHDAVVGDSRRALEILFAAVGLILLIACANVANLFLAKASSRQKEIAIRAAVGAGRGRLVRQLLTEALLVGLMAGVPGYLLALKSTDVLVSLASGSIPRVGDVGVDIRVLGFTLGISLLSGLVFGVLPALGASKTSLLESLKEGGQTVTGVSGLRRARSLLVVLETALAFVLVVCASLLIKSFSRLEAVDPGFDSRRVVSMNLSLPSARYQERDQQGAFYKQLVERVQSIPGVDSAAVVNYLPLEGGHSCDGITIDNRPPFPPGAEPCAEHRRISPQYFQTMGIPLLKGRIFDDRDRSEAPQVAIIDDAMARRFWADYDPLGKRVTSHGVSREIVGVVGSVSHFGLDRETLPFLYVPQIQDPVGGHFLVVRTRSEPPGLLKSVRNVVGSMDPELPVYGVQTMEHLLYGSLAQARFRTLLLGLFAAVALLLAAVGVYGVIFYSVSERTHEMGVRMALGAGRGDVLKLVVKEGMGLAATGVVLGMIGALALTRLLSSLLFEVSPTDPVTFAIVTLVLTGTALLASYVPARRASRVEPVVALRYE